MIKISALFLITIFSFSSCLEISPINAELLPNQSSKSKLIEMMVEVKTEGDVNTMAGFLSELKQMLDRLVDAQRRHQEIHKNMMAMCTEEDAFRLKEVTAAKVALQKAIDSRTRCKASLDNAERDLPLLRATKHTYVKELRRATVARAHEVEKYRERKDALTQALNFLRDFIQYVTKKMKGTYTAFALAEMSQNLLKHAAKVDLMEEAVPILVAIAQEPTETARKASDYTYRANQGLGDRLKQALSALVASLQRSHDANEQSERKAEAAFVDYSRRLNSIIATLRANIKRLKLQIIKMRKCVETEDGVIRDAAQKEARNALLRLNASRMCATFNEEFIDATKNRLDEVKTMNEILVIVHKRFARLPRDLVTYLETVKNGWIKYVNSTKFLKFVAYQRRQYVENKHGGFLATNHGYNAANPTAAVVRGAHGID